MKILIISGYAFPTQNPRAFRTSELAEQLVRQGHSVTVYSPMGKYDYSEYQKETGVSMKDIPSVMTLPRPNMGKERNILTKVLWRLLRKLVDIPEVEYAFRVPSIIKKEPDTDLLITIATPHMIHVGAAREKTRRSGSFPKVWIADSGDPYYLNPMHHYPSYMKRYEKKWCGQSDFITVPTEESRKGYFEEFWNKIEVIPQGFDFSKTPIASYVPGKVPTFAFAGRLYPGQRDLSSFMDYLLGIDIDFKFKIITFSHVDPKYSELSRGRIEVIHGMSRKDVIWEISKCDFLINVLNPDTVQTPSKLIDYALSGRPVMNVSNDFREQDAFLRFMSGDYSGAVVFDRLEKYSIVNVAAGFMELYSRVAE